jgi:signal transduction histidine kinase
MIKQVLLNLLINAQQAMENGGEIMILTGIDENHAQIIVNDTGKGIEHEKIDKIFNAFYTSRTGGSGLGLATAKKIIEAHMGSISVSSEIGKGSSFKIILPLASDTV